MIFFFLFHPVNQAWTNCPKFLFFSCNLTKKTTLRIMGLSEDDRDSFVLSAISNWHCNAVGWPWLRLSILSFVVILELLLSFNNANLVFAEVSLGTGFVAFSLMEDQKVYSSVSKVKNQFCTRYTRHKLFGYWICKLVMLFRTIVCVVHPLLRILIMHFLTKIIRTERLYSKFSCLWQSFKFSFVKYSSF